MRYGFLLALIVGVAQHTGCGSRNDADIERILKFDTHISVLPGDSLLVEEKLIVNVAGKNIKRGIYREVLTSHGGRDCPIRVIETSRDGAVVPFKTERHGERLRIRVVLDEGLLEHGQHTFRFKYEIQDWLDTRDGLCKLDWNATGIRWSFPIDEVSACVSLPDGVDPTGVEADATSGAHSQSMRESRDGDTGDFVFVSEDTVRPGDGIAIHLSWPVD
jgi:hypothetical protein